MKRFLSLLSVALVLTLVCKAVLPGAFINKTVQVAGGSPPFAGNIKAWWDNRTADFSATGTAGFVSTWTDRVGGFLLTRSGLSRPRLITAGANNLDFSVDWLIAGTFTSGTFTDGEAVLQTTSAATAYANGAQSSGGTFRIVGYENLGADSSSTWVGQSSGAIFTPGGPPTQQAASRYMDIAASGSTFTWDRQASSIFIVQRRPAASSGTVGNTALATVGIWHMGTSGSSDGLYYSTQQLTYVNGTTNSTGFRGCDNIETLYRVAGTSQVLLGIGKQSTTVSAAAAGTLTGGYLGNWDTLAFPIDVGSVLGVLVYNRELTSGEVASVQTFIESYYGGETSTYDKMVVMDGDSTTRGVGSGNLHYYGWPDQMARLFTNQPRYSKVAQGGQFAADAAFKAGTRTTDQLAWGSTYGTRTVTLLIGINDIATGGSSAATLEANITTWATAVRAADAGVKILGITILPYSALTGPQDTIRTTVNTWILGGGGGVYDYTYDAANATNLTDSTNTTYYSADHLHPTAAGYAIIASGVKAVLVSNSRL